LYTAKLVEYLGNERPFYALHPVGMMGEPMPPTIEGMAALHIAQLKALQPEGPYSIGGYCNGGIVAFEIAQQLRASGDVVRELILLSATGTNARFAAIDRHIRNVASALRVADPDKIGRGAAMRVLYRMDRFLRRNAAAYPRLADRTRHAANRVGFFAAEAARDAAGTLQKRLKPQPEDTSLKTGDERLQEWMNLRMRYVPAHYDGDITHIVGEGDVEVFEDETLGWRYAAPHIKIQTTPGAHGTYLTRHLDDLAVSIKLALGGKTG
jgi:thioesterase domain-containing protein